VISLTTDYLAAQLSRCAVISLRGYLAARLSQCPRFSHCLRWLAARFLTAAIIL